MTASALILSVQQLIDAAKAPFLAFGQKDWKAVKACVTPSFIYEEVATHRKVEGVDQVVALWQGWATAFPDAAATFHGAVTSGNTVVLELTWTGTHTGPLEMPTGPIAATGKRIEFRACNVMHINIEKAKAQSQRQYFDMATLLRQLGVMV